MADKKVKLRATVPYLITVPEEMTREQIEKDFASGQWCGDGTLIRNLQKNQDENGCFCKECSFVVESIDGVSVDEKQITLNKGKATKKSLSPRPGYRRPDERELSVCVANAEVQIDLSVCTEVGTDDQDYYFDRMPLLMEEAEFLHDMLSLILNR